ncbi:metal ABC transporter substrate-binding protein [Craterilacuibacter sp. RT1T]|uniref:metal ABC transporter substrate-binding protein n=1 Tax=Craterilacuibacter sp. RT1T TaxID=2942211 RepID=UPI0020C06045|nr:metal ABC transporter substrate-binding protein [Craterilacuibacter sp. RT1T]MCL6263146.1 metal ABC transporter substrate-binding protein [Craterilacuibacter sp. RT1T]
MKKFVMLLMAVLPLSAWAKMPVVASFSIVADITREIGGDRVEVVSLVGPDQDAHVFQPKPADVKRVGEAKVFVVNGLGYEGWMERLTRAANFKGVVVAAASGVSALKVASDDHGHGHSHGAVDPHAWHDPARVQNYIHNIEAGLIKADPAGRDVYRQRAAAYSAKVKAMDTWAARQFAAIPQAQRKVLSSHNAFAYLGARYQISFLAPQGVSTDAEASAKSVARLVRQVKQENIRAVFAENMASQRLMDQLSREAGVKVGGKLYSDALSPSGGPADSYLALFRHNVSAIVAALK